MKSTIVLNQGIAQIKLCRSKKSGNEITDKTHVVLFQNLLKNISGERKTSLRRKLAAVLCDFKAI